MSIYAFMNRILINSNKFLLYKKLNSQVISLLSYDSSAPPRPKPKKPIIPKITLIANDDISVTTLEEAQKLSKRRDLKLVKIQDVDTKSQRPIYKLMTGSEYHAEDLKQRENKKQERLNSNVLKGEKVLMIGANISSHDLDVNLNKIGKWINKRYEVRITVNGDASNTEKAEKVYSHLEAGVKDFSRIVQKRQKGNDLKFQILPCKENKPSNNENS